MKATVFIVIALVCALTVVILTLNRRRNDSPQWNISTSARSVQWGTYGAGSCTDSRGNLLVSAGKKSEAAA